MSVSNNNFMTDDVYVNSVEFLKREKTKFEKVISDESLLNVGKNMVLPITFECGTVFKTVDFIEDTSGIIVGQSGIGKTYLLNNIIKQWAMTTSPEELQLVVFDKDKYKNNGMKDVNKLPHVLGVLDDVNRFEEVIDGVLDELQHRIDFLKSVDSPSVRSYNKKSQNKVPNLVFVINDLSSILSELHDNTELYKTVKKKLSKISQEGRSLGIRLLISSSRTIDMSIPKNVVANSSFKFALELAVKNDYMSLGFDKFLQNFDDIDGFVRGKYSEELKEQSNSVVGGIQMPKGKGEGILKVMGEDILKVSSLEDDTNHDLTDVIKFWDSKGTKEKGYNILSNKLKGIFKD